MGELTSIRYRRAHPGDAEELAALRERQLLDEGMKAENDIHDALVRYFRESLSDESMICLVAEDGGIIATGGFCDWRLPPTFTNPIGRVAYLTNVYTKDAHRGRGIATHIVELLIGEARARGYALMRLHSSDMGRSVYLRHGFSDSTGYMSRRV